MLTIESFECLLGAAAIDAASPERRHVLRDRVATAIVAVLACTASLALLGSGPVSACDRLAVPSVGIDRCVVAGGQTQIDQGQVVRVDELSSARLHWLAGHRTSYGAAFSSLPQLQIGELVGYRGRVYQVSEYILFDRAQPSAIFHWIGANEDAVVLQTSSIGNLVHGWYAPLTDLPDLVAQSSVPGSPADPPVSPATIVVPAVDSPAVGDGVNPAARSMVGVTGDIDVGASRRWLRIAESGWTWLLWPGATLAELVTHPSTVPQDWHKVSR